MDERNRKQLEAMDPEKRARIEAMLAAGRTPESRARRKRAMEEDDREVRETGGITAEDGTFHTVRAPSTPAATPE